MPDDQKPQNQPLAWEASFRKRMAKFWAKVNADLKRESDAGLGPYILTPAGRAWLANRQKEDQHDQ